MHRIAMTSARRPFAPAFAWALYDWANSAFSTTVMAGFFPLFFKDYCNAGAPAADATFRLGAANSAAGLVVAVLAPVLGALADVRGGRKRFLALFTLLGAAATAALALTPRGGAAFAAAAYTLAAVGFSAALAFYDAFLPEVAKHSSRESASSLGYALGYLGGGLLFALNVWMYLAPARFGLSGPEAAVKASFVSVGVWWIVFALPLFIWVPEPPRPASAARGFPLRPALARLWTTLHTAARDRRVMIFLLAYWLYIDAIGTIVKMAVDYGAALGLAPKDLILALLITQFIGFPSAIIYGRLGLRLGASRAVCGGIVVYMAVTLWAALMTSAWQFYVLAAVVGLVQGGVQALSRAMFAAMVPPQDATQYFSLFNLIGKFAAIVGPLLVGAAALMTGSARIGILPLLIMFAAGLWLLRRVGPTAPTQRAAL